MALDVQGVKVVIKEVVSSKSGISCSNNSDGSRNNSNGSSNNNSEH